MFTATWCENRPLIVGIPRRSGEWSTESSWTSVARWMSSTIAARVTARGSAAPAPVACALSNSSVGRNSFPFLRRRCSLTSAMIGKSAAMSRRSSSTTRSSCPATGRWMSGRVTRASCWVTSARLGERLDPLGHVHEPDVRGEHAAVELSCLRALPLGLEGAPQPIENPQPLFVARRRQLQAAAQNGFRAGVRAFLGEADGQRLGGRLLALGGPQRLLELGDRFVEQAHLLEGDAQVIMRLEIRLVDVLVDPLSEARQHVLEVALLVAGGLLVRNLHP